MPGEIDLGSLIAKSDPKQLDSFLASAAKYEKLLDSGMRWLEKLEKLGVLPALIRGIGAKQGIPDIDKPLTNPLSIEATTASHRMLFKTLNDLPEEAIIEMFKRSVTAEAEIKESKEDVPATE